MNGDTQRDFHMSDYGTSVFGILMLTQDTHARITYFPHSGGGTGGASAPRWGVAMFIKPR